MGNIIVKEPMNAHDYSTETSEASQVQAKNEMIEAHSPLKTVKIEVIA